MNDETQLSNNPMVRAKQIAKREVELITKDEARRARLAELAAELAAGHAALEEQEIGVAWEEGRRIAEAYALLGDKDLTFQAWWDSTETWPGTSRPPFNVDYARQLKRLHAFCTGALSGRRVSQPKNPEGFTTKALLELVAPKYVKDRHQREVIVDKDDLTAKPERTKESAERLAVVNAVYAKLRDRAGGRQKGPITRKEVVDALQDAFRSANMPVLNRAVRRTSIKDMLDKIDRQMNAWYFTFEGDQAAIAAMRSKIAECLAEWDAWEEEANA
jgi:hypothetical protein